jgi:hypothetical protein
MPAGRCREEIGSGVGDARLETGCGQVVNGGKRGMETSSQIAGLHAMLIPPEYEALFGLASISVSASASGCPK